MVCLLCSSFTSIFVRPFTATVCETNPSDWKIRLAEFPPPSQFEGIRAVHARRSAVRSSLLDDRGSDNGLSRLVGDRSRHCRRRLGEGRRRKDDQHRRQCQHPPSPAVRLQFLAKMCHRNLRFLSFKLIL